MYPQQHHELEVSSWVVLDESCDVSTEVHSDHTEMMFGSHSAFGLVLTGGMVDKLAEELADAQRRFHELDRQPAPPAE